MSAGPLVALQAFSSVMGAVEKYGAARQEARALDENARRTDYDGAIQGQEMRMESRAAIGEQLAAGAASGVAIGTGSALDLIGESAQEAEFEILNLRRQAADQSANLRYQAKVTRRGATSALFRDLINTGSQAASAASGAGDAAALSAARGRERASVLPRETGTGIPLPGRNSIRERGPYDPAQSPWMMNLRGPR
jgi:hypothetical protein